MKLPASQSDKSNPEASYQKLPRAKLKTQAELPSVDSSNAIKNAQPMSRSTTAGPHQIIRTYRKYEEIPTPFRKPQCQNYSACLDIAACLDWDSFTCQNCNETIEPSLLWRMRAAMRKDKLCQQLFTPPEIGTTIATENQNLEDES